MTSSNGVMSSFNPLLLKYLAFDGQKLSKQKFPYGKTKTCHSGAAYDHLSIFNLGSRSMA